MSKNKYSYSSQFPIKQKNIRYKHDFKIKDGYISFNYFGQLKKFTGFDFIKWLRDNYNENFFKYIVYKWDKYNIIKVPIDKNENIVSKNTKTKEYTILKKMPILENPKILGAKPTIHNPIYSMEEEYKKREDAKREYQTNLLNKINQEIMSYEKTILHYNEFINENWIKKAALAGALATSSLSGYSQQNVDTFSEFNQSSELNKNFKSFDDVNSWLKSNFNGDTKWIINSLSIKDKDDEFTININRKKSNVGYNKIILAVNKEGKPSESRDNVLSKNKNSKEIKSGKVNFKGITYNWYLIGINPENDINHTITKSDNDKSLKDINKKELIDPQAYSAIYKFETTKGRIVKGSDGNYKATSMEIGDKKYDVHQKDNVIKNHIEKSIGLETWYKIPPKFRMQIFSYMFNSDSYEDKKGDRFRWIAGLAQAVNPDKFSDRQSTMANPKEAIEYIKTLDEKDFEKHYKDYLDVLHSQYASLSTPNGDEYDKAAKELSWFVRPIELDKYYKK